MIRPSSSFQNPGRILIFNGASSSGKTSLCKALLPLLPCGSVLLSVDDFLAAGGLGGMHLVHAADKEGPELVRSFHDAVFQASLHAPAVLVDHVIGECPEWLVELRRLCRGVELTVVKVACGAAELVRREQDRRDRKADVFHALRQHAAIHGGISYDAEVDTTDISPELAANLLNAQLSCTALTTTA